VEGNLTVLGNLNAMIMIDASNIMGDLNVTGNVNAPKIVGNLDGDICDDTTVFGTLTATANVVAQKLVGNLFGGICYNTTVVSAASYSVNANDDFIFVDRTTTGTATITLPVISTLPNLRKIYHIVDSGGNASTNNITINRSGGDTINGETSALIDLDNNSISVVADLGSRWIIF
jgi:hypothetical protein